MRSSNTLFTYRYGASHTNIQTVAIQPMIVCCIWTSIPDNLPLFFMMT
jgi:hypothetical protein